jgi:AmmeMemoRadiSam system protein B
MENHKQLDWRRFPAVAGRFYPESPAKLKTQLEEYLKDSPSEKLQPIAVFAPHAGYIYSGKIAGDIYKQIVPPQSAFVLCPNHSGKGPRISVWGRGQWETPLGSVPVDEELANQFILSARGEARLDREAHLLEHAIEVQVPFLLAINPNIRIVPITLGPLRMDSVDVVAQALAETLKKIPDKKILIVASTDMSHFLSGDQAKACDEPALKAIERMDAAGLYQTVVEKDISMCGFIPTTAAMLAAKALGAKESKLVSYGNSGDASGDYRRVVAYAAGWIK